MNDIGIERRTKIVCTIGPATSSPAQLRALLERGMNVARLNFSHGEPAEHAAVLAGIRALRDELGVPTAVLQDLAGPKVRIGTPGRKYGWILEACRQVRETGSKRLWQARASEPGT